MSDFVSDDEMLYRCIFYGRGYQIDGTTVRVSSQAFADRSKAPSIDRAKLCDFDPQWTQKDSKDAVVCLIAGEIRVIDVVQRDSQGNELYTYKIDVCPRPLDDNPAHAQIEPSPEYKNNTPFRKVLERLALLSNRRISKYGWEIEPYELRIQES